MGFTTTLLSGAGEYLDRENVGAWNPPYLASDVVISIDQFGTADKAIRLTAYEVSDDLSTLSTIGLQAWVRGAPKNRASAKDISDRLIDALHGLRHTEWAGIPIIQVWLQSSANHGLDANDREERSLNFYIQLNRSGTHRTD